MFQMFFFWAYINSVALITTKSHLKEQYNAPISLQYLKPGQYLKPQVQVKENSQSYCAYNI